MRTFYQFLGLLCIGHLSCRIYYCKQPERPNRSWGSGDGASHLFYSGQPPARYSCPCYVCLQKPEVTLFIFLTEIYQLKLREGEGQRQRLVLQKALWRQKNMKTFGRKYLQTAFLTKDEHVKHITNPQNSTRKTNKQPKQYKQKVGELCGLTCHWRRCPDGRWAREVISNIMGH